MSFNNLTTRSRKKLLFVSKPIDITVLVKNEVLCDTVTLTDIYQNIKEGVYDIVINNFNSKRKILSPTIYSRSK